MEKPMITLEGLSKFYTSAQNVVVGLNQVSLSFNRGEFVAITGESGSGKSTLAHVIGGILPYESGEMLVDGKPTSHYDGKDWETYRRDCVSFISQSYGILMNSTVLENVVSALRLSGTEKAEAAKEAEKILKRVELWELRSRRAAKLSSGQKQRLSIARALAKPAAILLADEPTGNLDPENSAKVIHLLADAAKERLVILITHDFAEAEDYATRHISLQDGRVVMDAQLRPANAPRELPAAKSTKGKPLSGYAARLQLGGRPVWSALVLLFFALTAFAVFAFLGTFLVALDDTPTRIYDDEAFPNGDKNRVVVQRLDGEPFTQEDYDKLLAVKHVQSLDSYGMANDISVFYIRDQHYKSAYRVDNIGTSVDPIYVQVENIQLLSSNYFLQTVPMTAENGSFLTAGRLPEKATEVVAVGDESRIGQSFRVYFRDGKNWSRSHYAYLDVTVVGVTDRGSGLYFHEHVGMAFNWCMTYYDRLFLPDEGLANGECALSKYQVEDIKIGTFIPMYSGYGEPGSFVVAGLVDMVYPNTVLVSPGDFEEMVPKDSGTQVSLHIQDYSYTDRVLEAVRDLGYIAVSPYQIGSTTQVESLAQERQQTLMICIGALLAVVALQVIVLRAMFGSELENYRLLANIGLVCGTAKRSVLWQILLFTLLGQGIGGGALLVCNAMGVQRIVNIVKYLPGQWMALLSAVHLAAALLAALWIAGAVQKRVYPMSRSRTDLKLEDEEVAE
ncbi:MAG: ABC transporter ATP-binding protein [Faecousia sp.]